MRVFIVNDYTSTGKGQHTFWNLLLEHIPGAVWAGGVSFRQLAVYVEGKARAEGAPDVLIRNGTFFGKIDLDVPQIAFYQDNAMTNGVIKSWQYEVAMASRFCVFNSPFMMDKYPDIVSTVAHSAIPVPIDYDLFKPLDHEACKKEHGIRDNSVCWIGANNRFKGFDTLYRLIKDNEDIQFVVIRKDRDNLFDHLKNVRQFFSVPHSELVEIINACRVGLCTSTMESQHLAGLEMGACGLPMIASNVGVYWGRYPGAWGVTVAFKEHMANAMRAALKIDHSREDIRGYWMQQGFGIDTVMSTWKQLVETLA